MMLHPAAVSFVNNWRWWPGVFFMGNRHRRYTTTAKLSVSQCRDFSVTGVCHFLCLATKKLTKENSRTKELLRPFVRPTHLWCEGKRKYRLHSCCEQQGGGCAGVVCGASGCAVFRLVFFIIDRGCRWDETRCRGFNPL